MQLSSSRQFLEVYLLVAGMLVNNENVIFQCANNKSFIELTHYPQFFEVTLLEHPSHIAYVDVGNIVARLKIYYIFGVRFVDHA